MRRVLNCIRDLYICKTQSEIVFLHFFFRTGLQTQQKQFVFFVLNYLRVRGPAGPAHFMSHKLGLGPTRPWHSSNSNEIDVALSPPTLLESDVLIQLSRFLRGGTSPATFFAFHELTLLKMLGQRFLECPSVWVCSLWWGPGYARSAGTLSQKLCWMLRPSRCVLSGDGHLWFPASSSSVTSQRFPELAQPFFGHVHTEIGLSNLKAILPRKESSHMSALIYNVQIIKPNS